MGIQLAQFLLALSLLIVLHELGHFIPAKIFKTRVEKFMLFFDPYFAIFKKKIGETTYGIGWLPLGGYVKISGMVDESMDTEDLDKDPEPWEFRAKPGWQRLIILSGGVIVNFLLGYLIYVAIIFTYGTEYIPNESLKYGIWTTEVGNEIGIQTGDKIVRVNSVVPRDLGEARKEFILGLDGELVLNRNGQEIVVPINEVNLEKLISDQDQMAGLFMYRQPYVVALLSKSSVAKEAGMEVGDSLVSLNGQSMFLFDQFFDAIPQYKNQEITIGVMRGKELYEVSMVVPEEGKIGIGPANSIIATYGSTAQKYTLAESASVAVGQTTDKLSSYVRQFKLIFRPSTGAYKQVGGFYTMLKQYSPTWDWRHFWELTAFISLMLGFLNIMPIPALDGGHILFVLIEMVTGRKPSIKVLEVAQTIGFILLLGLLVLANGNDILKAFQ